MSPWSPWSLTVSVFPYFSWPWQLWRVLSWILCGVALDLGLPGVFSHCSTGFRILGVEYCRGEVVPSSCRCREDSDVSMTCPCWVDLAAFPLSFLGFIIFQWLCFPMRPRVSSVQGPSPACLFPCEDSCCRGQAQGGPTRSGDDTFGSHGSGSIEPCSQSQVKRAWPFVNWKSGVIILVSLFFFFMCDIFHKKWRGNSF